MCGISGIYHYAKGQAVDRGLLLKSARALSHRGPDDEGFFIAPSIGLAHRRLSIIDLAGGHQPVFNEDKSIATVCNGEIYNYKELTQRLKAKGHRFYTKSDTEVLVHLYEEEDEDFVKELNGMFAFAIWDSKKRKLLLGRDRVGIKPLYYHDDGTSLRFASEIKALLVDPLVERKIDLRALDCYLTFCYIPSPHSIFQGIKKLPPGHLLICGIDGVYTKRYWEVGLREEQKGAEGHLVEILKGSLQEAVKTQLVSDVPVGVFLSGGIDSSALVAFMSRVSCQPVMTFSIGFQGDPYYTELEYARIVARQFHTKHYEFIVKPDICELLPRLVWHLDEPFADSAAVPLYYLSEMARSHVKVVLTGDGGDELFGGYPRYLWDRIGSYYQAVLPQGLRKNLILPVIKRLPSNTSHASLDFLRRLKKFVYRSELSPCERHLAYISILTEEVKHQLYSEELRQSVGNSCTSALFDDYFKRSGLMGFYNRRMYTDLNTTLPDQMLTKTDRMSMMASLEARVPFLDNSLLELAFRIPSYLKIHGRQHKFILKECLSDLLPANILQRKKHGLEVPLNHWFRNELKGWLLSHLSEAEVKKRGYFNPEYVSSIIKAHIEGKENYGPLLWALLVFETWHKAYIDEPIV